MSLFIFGCSNEQRLRKFGIYKWWSKKYRRFIDDMKSMLAGVISEIDLKMAII